jgi:hypothetical protein
MGWEDDLEAKHGRPLDEIAGHVYVLHYEEPQVVNSVSGDYAGRSPRSDADGWLSATAIRHYGRSVARLGLLTRTRTRDLRQSGPCETALLARGAFDVRVCRSWVLPTDGFSHAALAHRQFSVSGPANCSPNWRRGDGLNGGKRDAESPSAKIGCHLSKIDLAEEGKRLGH